MLVSMASEWHAPRIVAAAAVVGPHVSTRNLLAATTTRSSATGERSRRESHRSGQRAPRSRAPTAGWRRRQDEGRRLVAICTGRGRQSWPRHTLTYCDRAAARPEGVAGTCILNAPSGDRIRSPRLQFSSGVP